MPAPLNVSVSQLDIAAAAFGWGKAEVAVRTFYGSGEAVVEHRHVYDRNGETVAVDENVADGAIVHFAWNKNANNFAMVGDDYAGVEALVQLSQPA